VSKFFSPWWLLLLAMAGAAALALVYAGIWSLPIHKSGGELGQMGDFFGGLLNPLVSLLTLFVAISVWQLQKTELKVTNEAMKSQDETAKQQRQEQRFFDLLNVYYRTVESISYLHKPLGPYADSPERFEGKAAIAAWLESSHSLKQLVENKGNSLLGEPGDRESHAHPVHQSAVAWTTGRAKNFFDSYFRVVRHLLTEAPSLLGDQHWRYVSLFRAQLSEAELIVLAYHLWLDPNGQNMTPLFSKYHLLDDLPRGDLRTELHNTFGPGLVSVALPADHRSTLASEQTEVTP